MITDSPTTPASKPTATDWLRALAAAKTDYEERLGWPVTIEIGNQRLVLMVGGRMDAITMPARLGRHVLAELGILMLAGPVMAGLGYWTFLTGRCTAHRPNLPAELFPVRVRLAPRGTHVIVPSGRDAQEWVRRPEPGHALPPWSVVIGTTRRVASLASALAADRRPALPAAAGHRRAAGGQGTTEPNPARKER